LILAIAALLYSATAVHPQSSNQPLDSRIRAEIAPFKGKVFLYAKNLDTGET
jgi:hypothetical protein